MMSEDAGAEHRGYSTTDPEKRVKIAKAVPPNLGPLPSHLANARNLAVRTTYSPGSSQTSTNSKVGFNGAHGSNKTATQSVTMTSVGEPERAGTAAVPNPVQSHRNKSKSKSSSPIPTPVQVASPAPLSSDPSSVLPTSTLSSVSNGVTHQLHMSGGRAMDSSALASIGDFSTRIPGDSGSLPLAGSTLASTTSTSMPASKTDGIDRLSILEIFRVGMSILDALTSNPVCKSFINKVPLSFSHYYDTIKKPMDLTTIEHKLWKTVALYNQAITAGTATVQVPSISPLLLSVSETLANGVTEGYADLQQFEKDLRRIYLNATKFNASTHVIFKEAQAFQTLYTNLLETSKQE
ncbi:hypothetical protein BGW38_005490 [Lunasporangiospora selenospora]|uniref:Bromo domain-containing protein n=1 Tax=Lunasporangiospora selenospora TaxID=979761 RepID=A0A9P6KBH2_9FUNG|nr:hypothetical protein BGW38_005490 [Lunasporangiospora selenospora]